MNKFFGVNNSKKFNYHKISEFFRVQRDKVHSKKKLNESKFPVSKVSKCQKSSLSINLAAVTNLAVKSLA